MLNQLIISNYALIDSADIRLENGFTVITGETGAGKSIMLGALALILGQRSDTSAMRDKEQKCVVEAHFNIKGYGLTPLFTSEDIDYDDNTVIRREILPSGKSRAFVNDTPVTLNFLKELTQHLIDIHSQHQNLLLGEFTFQLMVVDTVAGNDTIKTDYQNEYHKLRQLQKERAKLVEKNEKQKADRDYWEFQVNQLLEANLQEEEQVALEKELEQLNHIEEIQSALSIGQTLLSEQDPSVVDMLFQIENEISRVAPFINQGSELGQRLKSAYIELKDISVEIAGIVTATEFDPQRLRWVQERLDTIYSLQQKHHVDNVKALIEIRQNLEEKLSMLNSFDEQLTKLDQAIKQQLDSVTKLASELTKRRKSVFPNIKSTIEKQLHELGMPHARFEIAHNQSEQLREDGADEIQFLFTANKNGTLADIPKVASGGEMSRVMLSIKSLLSSTKGLPTIIFDEIDTGVSGEIADKMGRIMQTMANDIQVISITHLPQIAGKGSQHFKVFKNDDADQTVSQIKLLNNDERIEEIAGMLSGAQVSEAALTNARDLLGTN
ncbi:DNA repair protein RecN [Geofilum sp. OHC36d9]|uniref:DNA repair protein RecN n=1 Tax=Geofilum sp. OHC36d9 TaxID=3458413 RepID=UPI0040342EB7